MFYRINFNSNLQNISNTPKFIYHQEQRKGLISYAVNQLTVKGR